MDKVIENWDKILQTVKADYDVGDVAFNTWLKPLKVYDVKDKSHDTVSTCTFWEKKCAFPFFGFSI